VLAVDRPDVQGAERPADKPAQVFQQGTPPAPVSALNRLLVCLFVCL
jgi:hypothetical protein